MIRRITVTVTTVLLVCILAFSLTYASMAVLADSTETTDDSVRSIEYTTPDPLFLDVINHWARNDIEILSGMGLFTGTGDQTFSPNQTMTRAMFVTVLGRMANVNTDDLQSSVFSLPFTDIKTDSYYAPYVAWALNSAIVSGVSEISFAPEKEISRQEMCVMLYNLISSAGLTVNPDLLPMNFNDADLISSWAKPSVSVLSAVGLIVGSEGNFNPLALTTRAEAATLLARFINSMNSIAP